MLKKFIQPHQRDWDEKIPYLLWAYRSTVHESTKQTPNRMMYGRQHRRPVDMITGGFKLTASPSTGELNLAKECSEYIKELSTTLAESHEVARNQLKKSAERQKRNYDRYIQGRDFEEGEQVLLHSKQKKKGRNPKLQLPYQGPYTILQKIGDLNYKIQKEGKKSAIVHRDRLKPYQKSPQEEELE